MKEKKKVIKENLLPKLEDSNEIEVMPLRSHVISHNEFFYELKEGEKITVNKMFLKNLMAEKVI